MRFRGKRPSNLGPFGPFRPGKASRACAARGVRSARAALPDRAALRLNLLACRRAAPVRVPYLPTGALHAASTRSPTARATRSTPANPPGLHRTALGRSTFHPLSPPPLSGADSSRQSIFCVSTRCAPRPGPIPGPLTPPSPPADLHWGGPLEAASAAVPAPFAAALAVLTRFSSRARAGLILRETRTRGGPAAPPPPRRRPPAAPRRRRPHHTHSPPLSHHSPPLPMHISTPTTPSPSPVAPLVIPPLSPPAEPRARPCVGPLVL